MKIGCSKHVSNGIKKIMGILLLEHLVCSVMATTTDGLGLFRKYGTNRPDIVEVFGGHGEISMVGAKQGWLCNQIYDINSGIDLSLESERNSLKADLVRLSPRLVIVEFPCTPWSLISNMNYGYSNERKQELRRIRLRHKPFLELTRDIFEIQIAHGNHALTENPQGSYARKQKPSRTSKTTMKPLASYLTCVDITQDMLRQGSCYLSRLGGAQQVHTSHRD
jgi:hypothetical protein